MCLILVAWQQHPDFPLVVAANRDEFHARPTAAAAAWPEGQSVIGGRDLEAGGSWLGFSSGGRFAAVTNVREPGRPRGPYSRGWLPRDFLLGAEGAWTYGQTAAGRETSGFNLLVCDFRDLVYCSNRDGPARKLAPGIYGVSNHLLDTPWPKLTAAKAAFAAALANLPDRERFFALLADREIVSDRYLPATGVSLEWERLLSAIFVLSPTYGTRASTVGIMTRSGSALLEERSFDCSGQLLQSSLISTGV